MGTLLHVSFLTLKRLLAQSIMSFYSKNLNNMVSEDYRETGSSPTYKTEKNSYQLVIPPLTQKKLPPVFLKDLC